MGAYIPFSQMQQVGVVCPRQSGKIEEDCLGAETGYCQHGGPASGTIDRTGRGADIVYAVPTTKSK